MKKLLDLKIIRYIVSSGISFAIDMSIFYVLYLIIGNIFISTVIARIMSSFVNYYINRNFVFSNDKNKIIDNRSMFKFYTLVVIQMLVSAISVSIIDKVVRFNVLIIKFLVEVCLFLINYLVQKKFIYKNTENFNIKKYVKENLFIIIILLVYLVINIILSIKTNYKYIFNLSDEKIVNYFSYTIKFIAGSGIYYIVSLKAIWIILSELSILGIYKIFNLAVNKNSAIIVSVLYVVIDFILLHSVISVDLPLMFLCISVAYAFFKVLNKIIKFS